MDPVIAWSAAAVAVAVGGLVLRARRWLIGALLVLHGVSVGLLLAMPGAGSRSRGGMIGDQLTAGAWVFLFVWLALLAYVVPDGHAASPRWRWWIQAGLVGVVAFLVGAADDRSGFRTAHQGAEPPLQLLPHWLSDALGGIGLVLTVALVFGAAFAVRSRLRRATGDHRLQLLWLVWGATSLPVALILVWIARFVFDGSRIVTVPALVLATVGLPVSIGIAVLRHRLFDIRVVLSRTLIYGALTVGVVVVYAGLLFAARRLLGEGTAGGLVAVGVVAVVVHPAYSFLRRRIERWVYGYRSDPTAALRRLGASVESADPLNVVEVITASVAEALKVERAWVESPGSDLVTSPRAVRVALVHRGERVGDLVVEVPPGRSLSATDTALLHDLAQHAAVTVRASQLAGDLQASRSQIVTAREEERKRLRRDLHDGVGPALAAILLKLQAAQARTNEAERNALIAEIREETRAAITEIRRVVDDLRPPAIDEVGLLDAIAQRAASLSTDGLEVEVHGPTTVPPLPAAVEVAAFRIASEALTNVAKHSGASRCTVHLELDATLGLTVADNGRGASSAERTGVGWTSMSERAAELGGSCTISSRSEGGLVVRAVLPLDGAPDPLDVGEVVP